MIELSVRSSEDCVVIPVLNENGRLLRQLAEMAELCLACDIIVADGGSTDGSTAPAVLRRHGVSVLLIKTGDGRLSAQLRMAFSYALWRGYERIVTIDGNGKDGPEAIPVFLDQLRRGVAFVQGSRYLAKGQALHTPLDRHLAVKFIHAPLLSLGARFRYTDTTNGFRGFSREFLSDPRVQPFRHVFDTYNLHYYLSIRAPRLGFPVVEVPVRRAYPPTGKTPTKIRGFRARVHLLKQLLLSLLGKYDPDHHGT